MIAADSREKVHELIEALENRIIQLLEDIPSHHEEIAACQEALDHFKDLLKRD